MVNLDDYVCDELLLLPPNTHKFKHRILIGGDPKDPTTVLTGIPVIHNVTNQLVAWVEIRREKNRYLS
ncbi:MAG: hypothetical protein R2685_07970 [Candidatus Nitrosocosmicus sp.]|nr:hypothetical protein [Candidatus Nitrosocosmicus sp.]